MSPDHHPKRKEYKAALENSAALSIGGGSGDGIRKLTRIRTDG